jgi:hypothetical protein
VSPAVSRRTVTPRSSTSRAGLRERLFQ